MIPSSFKLLNHTITVIINDEVCRQKSAYGLYYSNSKTIYLADNLYNGEEKIPVSENNKRHTFLHECVHAILDIMNEDKLYKNEKFVDVFSGLLHQMEETTEYEIDKSKRKPRTANTGRTVTVKGVRKIDKKTKKKN